MYSSVLTVLNIFGTFGTLHYTIEVVKILLLLNSSYNCEIEFSAMVAIKNKLQLLNSLHLKLISIDVDINAVIKNNKKKLHPSH